ncbi:MAG TPA: hypothetical protein VFK57_18025 [Vicinamibacterales bacterium]|nr:hypothetical protein [Vicinamibacterales bacterium]
MGRLTSYTGCLVTSVVRAGVVTRMMTVAGVKSEKDTKQVPVAEVQVELLDEPSGALTTTVTGLCAGAPVTSTSRPVQPISVQLGPTAPHPEATAPASSSAIAETVRGIVTGRILAGRCGPWCIAAVAVWRSDRRD